ncbi:hypothetical protein CYMTET_24428 [Cymbomonas tetramitiformis]|uniref:J domain-containing protein n=1 Tax=Cymbomonas tetramitiformis TaxID=36881 RepID=A0AAE0L033_9CHLO|nr:hypothetical protein CYMTET_24428 [Cymbomonas tetramitiformis]
MKNEDLSQQLARSQAPEMPPACTLRERKVADVSCSHGTWAEHPAAPAKQSRNSLVAEALLREGSQHLSCSRYAEAIECAEKLLAHSKGCAQRIQAVAAVLQDAVNREGVPLTSTSARQVLRVPEDAEFSVIRKQHHALSLLLHPDKNVESSELQLAAETAFKLSQQALSVLEELHGASVHKRAYVDAFGEGGYDSGDGTSGTRDPGWNTDVRIGEEGRERREESDWMARCSVQELRHHLQELQRKLNRSTDAISARAIRAQMLSLRAHISKDTSSGGACSENNMNKKWRESGGFHTQKPTGQGGENPARGVLSDLKKDSESKELLL